MYKSETRILKLNTIKNIHRHTIIYFTLRLEEKIKTLQMLYNYINSLVIVLTRNLY